VQTEPGVVPPAVRVAGPVEACLAARAAVRRVAQQRGEQGKYLLNPLADETRVSDT
jgi:hypothetical protein